MPPDHLKPESVEWARVHIARYGDTDIFPIPFEFDALKNDWGHAKPFIEEIDLSDYSPGPFCTCLMPKGNWNFRIATQLDPLDALIYSAMVYEATQKLEEHRVSQTERIACSYRAAIEADGGMFRESNGWDDYFGRSAELAHSGKYSHVLVADIADFYNQAYHHRIENVLESAQVPELRAKNIERFLSGFTAKQSRGLPVGPNASILLAEACLDDVDKRLMSQGKIHVRYVDDFRIFCRSYQESLEAIQDLTEYLHTAHRLTLQSAKTKILSISDFQERELETPEGAEEDAKKARLDELLDEIKESMGYEFCDDDLPSDDDFCFVAEALDDVLSDCLSQSTIPMGVVRYVIRKATASRVRSIRKNVLDNLERLAPVFRYVSRYLSKTTRKEGANECGQVLKHFLLENDVGRVTFVGMWGLELLRERPDMLAFSDAVQIAENHQTKLGIRPAALLARSYKQVDWVRANKETWMNRGPWDRRAILWSGSVLPRDEKRSWLGDIKDREDQLERAVARAVLSS